MIVIQGMRGTLAKYKIVPFLSGNNECIIQSDSTSNVVHAMSIRILESTQKIFLTFADLTVRLKNYGQIYGYVFYILYTEKFLKRWS